MFIIEEELKKLPAKPGVYIMHGEKDEIIYVGKAISLKNRVRQYFQSSRNKGAKIERMVTHITRFEYIITDSELEALVLECNLHKGFQFRICYYIFKSSHMADHLTNLRRMISAALKILPDTILQDNGLANIDNSIIFVVHKIHTRLFG